MALPQKRTKRKVHPRLEPHASHYAKHVGLLSWTLNNVQVNLQAIFCDLLDRSNVEIGKAIWHAIKSDDGQRTVVMELAKVHPTISDTMRSGIIWVADSTGKIAAFRNDAVHTPFGFKV